MVLLLVLLAGAGCRRFANTIAGEKLLARVGERTLYLSQVEDIFTPGIAPADSVKLLENYIDKWVRGQLKIVEAERRFSDAVPDVERMVEEYRSSLLSIKLDDYWAGEASDTTFTAAQIAQYYEEHKGDFILDRTIVEGRIVVVPESYRQRNSLKQTMMWTTEEQREEFREVCLKYNFHWEDFPLWTDYPVFLSSLPAERSIPDGKLLQATTVQELLHEGNYYYVLITARRTAGMTMPLVRAEGMIKLSLAARRRAEAIRSREDSLMALAIEKHDLVINLE
jgi:hypothetical protein